MAISANKQNIKLLIAYDGTDYLGWQKTFTGASIEEELQKVLELILQEKVALQAASRTDRGVHAHGQVVNFFTTHQDLELGRLNHSLNALLPKSIVSLSATAMPLSFHPTLDCTGKEYRYSICNSFFQLPSYRLYSWHCPSSLDILKMREAAQLLKGTRDFAALCNVKKNESYTNFIRTVSEILVVELTENRLEIHVSGNHFLYKMVRNIVGLLIGVGRKEISIEEIPLLLKSGDRTKAGVTAPAHGLSLYRVSYTLT